MIKPLGNCVLIEEEQEKERTPGGIVLPASTQQNKRMKKGRVIAVGSGKMLESGQRAEVEISTGDRVIYEGYAGMDVEHDGKNYKLLQEQNVQAKILE